MKDKPIQWEIMASMDAVQAEHPDWSEEQCREEFNLIASAGLQKMLDEQEARRKKRKKPQQGNQIELTDSKQSV